MPDLTMISKIPAWLTILYFTGIFNLQAQSVAKPAWTHFYIDAILPGFSWGTGGPALADYDHDGDLDAVVSRRVTKEAWWYERRNDSVWIPHVMGYSENLAGTLGTTSIDMDHDGWMDVVFEKVWFRNPGNLVKNPDDRWQPHAFRGGGHDILGYDMNGDSLEDLVIYDGKKLAWYNTATDSLVETIVSEGNDDHGGTAPKGVGDLDGDGDPDLVIPGFWFENPGSDTVAWTRHEWPYHPVPNASYGRSIRAWITDINHDGKNDIVYSNCDTGGSHVFWVENKENGKKWISHELPDPPTREGDVPGTGSFHSLGVADFNLDGYPDIFAGEQEDPDTYMEGAGKVAMKPRGLKERGVIWYNSGGKNPKFEVFLIHVDNPGWHDAQLGDVDGDSDTDIVSKVWNADRGQPYHLDYWRNDLSKSPH